MIIQSAENAEGSTISGPRGDQTMSYSDRPTPGVFMEIPDHVRTMNTTEEVGMTIPTSSYEFVRISIQLEILHDENAAEDEIGKWAFTISNELLLREKFALAVVARPHEIMPSAPLLKDGKTAIYAVKMTASYGRTFETKAQMSGRSLFANAMVKRQRFTRPDGIQRCYAELSTLLTASLQERINDMNKPAPRA